MKTTMSRRALTARAGAVLAGMVFFAAPAAAAWPERPVTMVVPFPAGGSTDVIARLFADRFTEMLGTSFVVENRPGANGNIGAGTVARAAPDGYTLLVSGNGQNAMNHGLYTKMPYDSRTDFAHIALFAATANALVVHPDFPARTLGELLDLAAKGSESVTLASPGNGSSGHLAMELLQRAAKVKFRHVPYRGAAPVLTDVLGNHVPVGILNADVPTQFVHEGKLRVLAVTGETRSSLYPDAPTVAEAGFPGFAAMGWFGLSAPAKTPREIVDRLSAATQDALKSDKIRQRLATGGYVAGGGTPQAYAAFISAEIDKWTEVVRAAGIVIE